MKKAILNKLLTLQKRLKPLTPTQTAWAHSHYTQCAYVSHRYVVWCQHCGAIEPSTKEFYELNKECGYQCPRCGKRLELRKMRTSSTVRETCYHVFPVPLGDWQVFRCFLAQRINTKECATRYTLDEVFQCWINSKGAEYILSRSYYRSPLYGVKWDVDSPLTIPREHNYTSTGQYIMPDMFDLRDTYVYQRSGVTKLLKRNGWNKRFLVSPVECARRILVSPQMEMLAKTQIDLFLYHVKSNNYTIPYLHAVKICNRNKYSISDPSLWTDYIGFLSTLGLDTHNARYVCPTDLHAAHDKMMKRVARKAEKEKLEQQIRDAALAEDRYQKTKGRFFGICFGNDKITVTVIRSVAEMREEGATMQHCVFANRYYDCPDSLILSAKDQQGNRIETIEVNTKTLTIIQSRGAQNQNTPHHNEIINLVNKNMYQIQQAI